MLDVEALSRESEEEARAGAALADILARSVSERKMAGSPPTGFDIEMVSTNGSLGSSSIVKQPKSGFVIKGSSTTGLDIYEEGTTVVSSSCTIEDEGCSPAAEVACQAIDDPVSENNATTKTANSISEGLRYFLRSGQLMLVGVSLLAFSLTFSIWNFWRAVTYTLAPIPDKFHTRCILNAALCLSAIGVSLIVAYTAKPTVQDPDRFRHVRVLCNVLGGIGLWELIESTISFCAHSQPVVELVIYAVWLVVCIVIALVLHKWRNIRIVASSLMSPV